MLEAWLARDSRNQADFTLARLTWSIARKLDTSDEARRELRALKSDPVHGRWGRFLLPATLNPFGAGTRILAPALVAVVLIVVGVGWFLESPRPSHGVALLHNGDSASTAIGEISSYMLPDGSKITVNAQSAVRVGFTKTQRQIFLDSGEAFFEVHHNTKRPFVVVAGLRKVVVTGTKFDVEVNSPRSALQVAVVEGHVNVGDNHAKADDVTTLHANDVFLFPEKGPPARLALAANRVSAWQTRRLYFEGTTIGDVLFSVNRFTAKPLQLADPQLAELPLSGAFTAGDTDAVLFSLQSLYGIQATDNGDVLMLHAKK
jgi:transmembrane sensor